MSEELAVSDPAGEQQVSAPVAEPEMPSAPNKRMGWGRKTPPMPEEFYFGETDDEKRRLMDMKAVFRDPWGRAVGCRKMMKLWLQKDVKGFCMAMEALAGRVQAKDGVWDEVKRIREEAKAMQEELEEWREAERVRLSVKEKVDGGTERALCLVEAVLRRGRDDT